MQYAKLVDIHMTDKTKLQPFSRLPKQYMKPQEELNKATYCWSGEIQQEDMCNTDKVVTLSAAAVRQRRQEDGKIIRMKLGKFTDPQNNEINLKLMGIIRNDKLYIVTEPSNRRVKDIAPRTPVRVAGLPSAIKRFSSCTN